MKAILTSSLLLFSCAVSAQKVSILHVADLPKEIEYSHEPKLIQTWKDKSGEHIIIITEVGKGDFFTPTWRSEILVEEWTKRNDIFCKVWKIWDFSDNFYSKVSYIENSLNITDLDGDGVCETSFFYEINPDGLDPLVLKCMFHVNERKLAIRGKIPKHLDDAARYEMRIDDTFNDYNPAYKKYATSKWDDLCKMYQEKYDTGIR